MPEREPGKSISCFFERLRNGPAVALQAKQLGLLAKLIGLPLLEPVRRNVVQCKQTAVAYSANCSDRHALSLSLAGKLVIKTRQLGAEAH